MDVSFKSPAKSSGYIYDSGQHATQTYAQADVGQAPQETMYSSRGQQDTHREYENRYGDDHHDYSEARRSPTGRTRSSSDPENPSFPAYQEYPKDKPFINDDYRRDPNKPVKAFPESNRQAVMSALRGLQDKIRQLELERSAAEDNLRTLATETSKFKDILHTEPDASYLSRDASHRDVSHISQSSAANQSANLTQQNRDVHDKLDTAEHRCQLLEKQLDHMRNMVQNAEHGRSHAVQRAEVKERQRDESEEFDIRRRLDKIADLEREHLKLTATQTMAESKIRTLEDKLREERHHRHRIQEKAAELETAAETNRILLTASADGYRPLPPKKTKKKKKKVQSSKRPQSGSSALRQKHGREPTEHYRLNLAEIPFVAGKATTPSHSLPANFQEVLSLMKVHNTKLCKSPRQHARNGLTYFNTQASSSSSGFGSGSEEDMSELLLQLQDEFGQMSFEHQELSRQIQEARDSRLREDLERELDNLVCRMESKGEQIARLRRHQNTRTEKRKKKKRKTPREETALATTSLDPREVNGEVEVTTTIRTKGRNVGQVMVHPGGAPCRAQASLNLLKDLKKIQTTLRKDDISWDD